MAVSIRKLRSLRRGTSHPPLGRVRLALDLGLPLVTNIAWAILVLLGLPVVLGMPLAFAVVVMPDVATALIASATVALVWGTLRTVVALSLVRGQNPKAPLAATRRTA